MMGRSRVLVLTVIMILILLVTSCAGQSALGNNPNSDDSKHTLTIWSFYPNKDMEPLVRNYMAAHPKIEVIHTGFAFLALQPEFRKRATQGLGPDGVIVTERVIPKLIETGLIEPLDEYNIETNNFLPKSMVSVRDSEDHLYGVPVALQTMSLCYNNSLVEKVPETLSGWLKQAQQGKGITIEPTFLNSMWGISALGGKIFDSKNNFVLKETDLAKWLIWLKESRKISTVYVDNRRNLMFDLFTKGEVAYYPCWSFEYVPLKEKLGDKLEVTTLPQGDLGKSAPNLETDTLVVNAYATAANKKLAVDFARFITQENQQLTLISAKEHTIAPINSKTEVDERLLPVIKTFAETAKDAIPFPMSDVYSLRRLRFYGDKIYARVINGVISPLEGAKNLLEKINNPPANENVSVSASAASDEVQEKVLVDVKPKADFLLQLWHIQGEILKRPVIWWQILLIAILVSLSWLFSVALNKLIKKFFEGLLG